MRLWRFASLVMIIVPLISPAAIAAEQHRLAFSKKLGVEIFADVQNETWCRETLQLRVLASDKDLFQKEVFRTLIRKLGSIIPRECPIAIAADISGFSTETGEEILRTNVSQAENWIVRLETPKTDLQTDKGDLASRPSGSMPSTSEIKKSTPPLSSSTPLTETKTTAAKNSSPEMQMQWIVVIVVVIFGGIGALLYYARRRMAAKTVFSEGGAANSKVDTPDMPGTKPAKAAENSGPPYIAVSPEMRLEEEDNKLSILEAAAAAFDEGEYTTALRIFNELAEKDIPAAQFALGVAYERGKGVEQDDVVAAIWYRKAAEHGLNGAQRELGIAYENGRGVSQDYGQAAEWYRKAAEGGDAEAQLHLGMMYEQGEGVAKDYSEAFKWFQKAAEQDNAAAEWAVGLAYEFGNGIPVDQLDAAKWYRKSADQGFSCAQLSLGRMYYDGRGVPKDDAKAATLLIKAAEQDESEAQVIVSGLYEQGIGVPQDMGEAQKWLRLAAENGESEAQLQLGLIYQLGERVALDHYQAVNWFRKAAEQGLPSAQTMLGIAFETGKGAPVDQEEAFRWFRRAAEQGDAMAQYSLGLCYLEGRGVAYDKISAYSWLELAASQGLDDAISESDKLRQYMNSNEIAQVHKFKADYLRTTRNDNPDQIFGGNSGARDQLRALVESAFALVIEPCRGTILEADVLRNETRDTLQSVHKEYSKISLEPPDVILERYAEVLSAESDETNKDPYRKAQIAIAEVRSLKTFAKNFTPYNSTIGRLIMLGIMLCTGGIILGLIVGSTGAESGANVIIYLSFPLLIAPLLKNHFRKSAAVHHYDRMAKKTVACDQWINQWLEQKAKDYAQIADDLSVSYLRFSSQKGLFGAEWSDQLWKKWAPGESTPSEVRIGRLKIEGGDINRVFPNVQLNTPLPALIPFDGSRGLLFGVPSSVKSRTIDSLQGVMLRLLATMPPGKVKFTLIDPIGLGQNVAGFLGLGEFDESLITSRAWTEPQHIEEKLQELTEHMENVIQKYLRTNYATIEDYNRSAGEVAEAYRVLVVMDFPVNFSEAAARRLVSIAENGPRCGVYSLVMLDYGKKPPYGYGIGDLERASTCISWSDNRFVWDEEYFRDCHLELDKAPPNELTASIIDSVGLIAKKAMKVEVPFGRVLELADLGKDAWWTKTTENSIEVPLGPTGATKAQYLSLGTGTAHHALIVGRTGSGKSNLQHVIITSLALSYSPDEIQLYLVDFKQGVEFKAYAEVALPHARVIAIESEREFGMSVLGGLDDELRVRGELFRRAGVNDISQYRKKTQETMPRLLLLVDEFQEFFTRDDSISGEASQILERLTRQGRSAGIHVILATQSLAGSLLSQAVYGQIQVRIALQCGDSDSRMILADDNPAARSLSRPGEAIYNAASGLVDGNNPFQVAMFKDEDRSRYLEAVSGLAATAKKLFDPPIVFEGHEPARIEVCQPLMDLLAAADWPSTGTGVDAWLGEPIAILPPTSVRFRRQSGDNLMIVTREEEEGVGLLAACVVSLAIQYRPEDVKFLVVDLSNPDLPWAGFPEDMAKLFPHPIEVVGRRDVAKLLNELAGDLRKRLDAERAEGPECYLVIIGLQRVRDLREEEAGFGRGIGMDDGESPPHPTENFEALLRDGPEVGLHVVAWCDTYANMTRTVTRRMISEFRTRIAGTMGNDDSLNLLDDPAASKLDKPHRVVKFDDDRPGVLEKFRPYSLPDRAWLEKLGDTLHARSRRAAKRRKRKTK